MGINILPRRKLVNKLVLPIALILLILSFLPVWRCGLRSGLTFWGFALEHTIFSPHPVEYIPEEDYENNLRG